MKTRNTFYISLMVLALLVSSLACLSAPGGSKEPPAAATNSTAPTEKPAAQDTPMASPATATPQPQPTREIIRQWAVGATASSQFGESYWSPLQAAGAPDTFDCSDQPSAWASATGGGQDWLEVYYENAVVPSELNIHQTFGSNQVIKVEIKDTSGDYHEVYSGTPTEVACPYTMNVTISNADYEAAGVRITVDESFLQRWNEIDAVELVGASTGNVIAAPAPLAVTATSFPPPAGLLWRLGGEGKPTGAAFWVPQGIFVSSDNLIYVADYKGVIVLDTNGNQRNLIDTPEMDTIRDVVVGPDGNVYVADWGNHAILVYTPGGKFLYSFGSEGKEAGQFGTFGPLTITFGPDGNLYTLDKNENSAGESIDQIHIFSMDGKYLRSFLITEDYFAPDDLAFGPDGNLYILSGFARYLLIVQPDGTTVGRIGEQALNDLSALTFAFDANGNIYVAGNSVVKLDAFGNLLGKFGVSITDNQQAWPEGGFYGALGLGVTADGQQIFVTDYAGDFAYLTALTFDK